MKFLLLLLMTTNFQSYAATAAKTHMLILGGSGDPAGDSTIFDDSFSKMGDYYQSKQNSGQLGQASIAFDGGHTKTDALKTKFPHANSVQNFTKETYQQEIDRFKSMMSNNGDIKRGDQLLIYINTHGTEKDAPPNKTHSIATGDAAIANYNSGAGGTLVSVDQIAALKKAAADNGVKLAIVDLSCHSGNTQELADANTCIISATGKNHYAIGGPGFSGTFTGNLKSGENLESVFLKTRTEDTAADFPEISSPEGKLIEDGIYGLMTPYLQNRFSSVAQPGVIADKLTIELLAAASDPNYACKKDNSFNDLNKLLDQVAKNTTITKKVGFLETKESIVNFDEFKKALKDYKDIQDQLTEQMKAMHVEKLQTMEAINTQNKYSWAYLLKTDWAPLLAESQFHLAHDPALSASERLQYETNVEVYTKAQISKARIIQENPGITEYQNVVKNFENGQKKTMELSDKVAKYEKKLFNGLYKKYARENDQSNPCREFQL
jgi:hypothetical protein